MGAFLGALGGKLASGALQAGKNFGQAAKNNMKQLGPQDPNKQKQGGEARNQPPPSKQTHFAADIAGSKKKGGPVKKTGLYLLHKHEYVVPAAKRGTGKRTSRKKTVIKA